MATEKITRDLRVDILRVMGLLLIMLAHVSPPGILFQLRCFDVPMMVFISGVSYCIAGKSTVRYSTYLWSRAKRLLFPVWVFLTLFFVSIKVFHFSGFYPFLDTQKIVESYFLYSGIGYVWIMGIFFLIAVLSPAYSRLADHVSDYVLAFFSMLLFIAVSVVVFYMRTHSFTYFGFLLFYLTFSLISYGMIFMLGYKWLSFCRGAKIFALFIYAAAFCLSEIYFHHVYGKYAVLQDFKYPPSFVFAFFAITVVIIIDAVVIKAVPYIQGRFLKFISFIASNTIWIYLLHIPVVEYMKVEGVCINYIIKWMVAVILSVLFYLLQRTAVIALSDRIKKPKVAKAIRQVFTG